MSKCRICGKEIIGGEICITCAKDGKHALANTALTGTPDYYTLDINGPADFYLIADVCGCPMFPIFHAAKKLLFAGKRGAGKDTIQDVKEARDALNRWLEINDK